MKQRPIGISLASALYVLNALFYAYLVTLGFFFHDKLADFLGESTSPAGVGPSGLLRLGKLLPFYFLVMTAVALALAFGMWRLKNWARIVTMILVSLSLLEAGFVMLTRFSTFAAPDFARVFGAAATLSVEGL